MNYYAVFKVEVKVYFTWEECKKVEGFHHDIKNLELKMPPIMFLVVGNI